MRSAVNGSNQNSKSSNGKLKLKSARQEALRAELIQALRHAVDGEQRFGQRTEVREELDARWNDALSLLEQWVTRG